MYLKKLELLGFKSFAEKTEFTFPSSVTAIVGPNGCGKSNVVDAFKWIFGEQSAKGLRGEEMKDVIFNGTQTRKPTGFSEVTCVFDNTDNALPIDYSEVAITRRLFRSGESEYLINKQKCRLRDIKELLLDTGLGTSSYSMLEQGKIDVLLQASTLDRRIIFEEAAGISKYRVKKAETLRALERTEENLSRLGDIIDEVEKRMHRLKVQAGKARRFREHFDRLRLLRVRAALQDYRALLAERCELSAGRFLSDGRLARLADVLRRLKEALAGRQSERRERSASLAGSRERLAEAQKRRERTEERIEQDVRRLGEIAAETETRLAERGALAGTRERLTADLAGQREALERAAAEIAERGDLLSVKTGEVEGLRALLADLGARIEEKRRAIVDLLHERSRASNRVVQLDSELGSLSARRARVAASVEAAQREAGEQAAIKDRLAGELEGLRASLQELDRTRSEALAAADALREELVRAGEALAGEQAAVQDRRSRLDVLARFEAGREGIQKGVAAVLEDRERCPVPAEVRGMLAEGIQVERRYAPAVEAALGEHAQSLVVGTQEGGLALLSHVREGGAGGAEVIALDRIAPVAEGFDEGEYPSLLAEAGVIGRLSDLVTASGEFRPVIDRLLGRTILVSDLPTAVALSRNGLSPFRLATPEGALVEPWGAMAVAGPGSSGGIISRRSEMAELTAELERLTAALSAAQARRDEKAAALAGLEVRLKELLSRREAEAIRIGSTEGVHLSAAREEERALREARVGESEIVGIAVAEESLRAERESAMSAAQEVERRREAEESALGALADRLADSERAARVAGEEATELKVRLAEAEERGEGLRRSIGRLEEALAEEERRRAALESQVEELARRRLATEEDLAASRASLGSIVALEAELAREVELAESEEASLVEIESAFTVEIDRLKGHEDQAREERERLNLRDQEGKLKRNALVEKISDEYGFDLAAISEGRLPPELAPAVLPPPVSVPSQTVPPEGAEAPVAAPASLGGEEAPAPAPIFSGDDPSWNREAAETEIHELREKLRHIGNVNLEALDELDELQERHRFMTGQREDLRKAEKDLRDIIAEINGKSRELFLRTFEAVQLEFNQIFRKCFGGGMAELVLEDGADVLEAGIEIIARPPGKKLTSLTLMSGGEKTMTTIALLFAIFRSRPSPFCILDEVDAPLDEANVRRFVVLLRDFVKDSQFIIITHNKITMAEADSLYGITMEERGVSKRVAVEFETYDPDHPETLTASTPLEAGSLDGGDLSGTSPETEGTPV
jgi:chromosome segregation protein